MSKIFNGTERIEILGFELIALIANREKETIQKIEEEIANCNIVNYIVNKYKDSLSVIFDDSCPYNIKDWNKEFCDYSGWVEGNESRKFGITKEDDGLLLLLGLVLDIMTNRKNN